VLKTRFGKTPTFSVSTPASRASLQASNVVVEKVEEVSSVLRK